MLIKDILKKSVEAIVEARKDIKALHVVAEGATLINKGLSRNLEQLEEHVRDTKRIVKNLERKTEDNAKALLDFGATQKNMLETQAAILEEQKAMRATLDEIKLYMQQGQCNCGPNATEARVRSTPKGKENVGVAKASY